MTIEQRGNPPPPEQRITSLTHVSTRALSRYGLGDAQPVLLEDLTNIVYLFSPRV
jgi:hypothetical protein